MKQYLLKLNGKVIVSSHDKWLIKLYIAQRDIYDFEIVKRKKEYIDYDKQLLYYFGYSITTREMNFIELISRKGKNKMKRVKDNLVTIIKTPNLVNEILDNYMMYKNTIGND